MAFFAKLLGNEVVSAVDAVGNAFDKLFTSDEERANAEMVMAKLRQAPHMLQAEINRVEASHRSIFVAGWRPFIGWVCGVGFLWAFVGQPVFEWSVALAGSDINPPSVPSENMLELVMALLGLGGLRTYEKLSGRAK